MEFTLRPAIAADCRAINAIYNHYVACSTCTYQTTPSSEADRLAWFASHGERHPVIVVEAADGVAGWAALSPFHPREAYRFTVEDSVYVHSDFQGKGIGKALLAELMARAAALGHRSIIALVSADQPGSIALHARAGFHEAGRLMRVGYKFDRWLDVIYMQRELVIKTGHP